MCGINYSKVDFRESKFNFTDTSNKIILLLKDKNLSSALELVKKLRNNYIFIQIVKNNNSIVSVLNKILKLINDYEDNNYDQFDKLSDLKWVIESEIFFKVKRIREFAKKHRIYLNDKSIIFIRYFLYNISSMNYLESRGRDSLGVSLNLISKKPFIFKSKVSNKNSLSIFNKKKDRENFLNITIKFSKRIGTSGENTANILEIIKKVNLRKIDFKSLVSFEIFSHTRWASVGDVTNSNAHPLINTRKKN